VDLGESDGEWVLPRYIDAQKSYEYIAGAVSAYSIARWNHSVEILGYTDAELASALAAWAARPELLEPKWPELPMLSAP
jgi:hypothetical protein